MKIEQSDLAKGSSIQEKGEDVEWSTVDRRDIEIFVGIREMDQGKEKSKGWSAESIR